MKKSDHIALGKRGFLFLACWAVILAAELPAGTQRFQEIGSPFIRNYTPEDYGAHSQNWMAIQDQRGVMYFANTSGILEFDGRNWNLIKTPSNSGVRSLGIDSHGTIWVGAISDLGFLACDVKGKTIFMSLLEKLDPKDRDFNDVWKTLVADDGVYFFTRNKIFLWNQKKIQTIPTNLCRHFAFTACGEIFAADRNRGICLVKGNTLMPLPFTDEFTKSENPSVSLLPYLERQLLIILPSGEIYRYELRKFFDLQTKSFDFTRSIPKDELLIPFPTEISEFIKQDNNRCFTGWQFAGNQYALPSRGGIIVMDQNGRLIRVINRNRGLLDDVVWAVYPDRDQNLWASTNMGIAYIESNSPVSFFNTANGLDGYLSIATRFNDRIFASSFKGLYYLQDYKLDPKNDNQHFVPVNPSFPEAWQFLAIDNHLLAGSNPRLVLIDHKFKVKTYSSEYVYSLGRTPKFPDIVFVGLMDGLNVLRVKVSKEGDMELTPLANVFKEIKDLIRNIISDGNGDLWITSVFKGLIHLRFPGQDLKNYQLVRYGTADGLPQTDSNFAYFINNRLLVATPKGIYEGFFSPQTDSGQAKIHFELEKSFGRLFPKLGIPVHNIMIDHESRIWVQSTSGIGIIAKDPDGSCRWDSIPFKEIPVTDENAYLDPQGTLWVSTTKGLFRYDPSIIKDYRVSYPALIRKVIVGKDTVIFHGANFNPESRQGGYYTQMALAQSRESIPKLAYKDNSIVFNFSAAFYEHESANRFRFILEGFDKGWSNWTAQTTKEYTNLPEGSYLFRVKALNIFEQESREAKFRFTIAPPWYRTILAFLGFAVIGFGVLMGGVRAYTFKLRREKERLEKLVALRTRELKEASLTDPLTGLRNRRYITEILMNDVTAFVDFKKYVLEAKDRRNLTDHYRTVFGVVLFDIDHFKKTNDTYGHEAGDKVLQQLAQILKSSVRADDAVMRIGGEEFLIVLKKTLPEYLETFARKIKDKIQEHDFRLDGDKTLKRTCSIGYTTFPFYEEHPELLSFEQTVMVADQGLYYSKDHGRNLAVKIEPTPNRPAGPEDIQKMVTSLDFALEMKYYLIKTKSQ